MTEQAEKLILVVDDESDVRKFLAMALEDAGFQVDTACDGFEALEKVQTNKPDLISLDLVMPKRSGARFYRDLQKNSEWSKIPVIIVTGHARDELGKADFQELTMSGPGVYLEKPVKPASYVAAVQKILGLQQAETAKPEDTKQVKQELAQLMKKADLKTLRKMLDATKKKD